MAQNPGRGLASALAILAIATAAFAQTPSQWDPSGPVSRLSAAPREVREAVSARDYPRAEELLIRAIEADASARKLLLTLGGVFFLDKKYDNCVIALEKARAANLLDAESRFTLALAYVNLDRRNWAREEFERLAAAMPKQPLYRFWLARLDFADQKYAACVTNSEQALSIDPSYWRALDSVGLCQEAQGNMAGAIAAYEKAMHSTPSGDPQTAWAALNLGVALAKMEQTNAAKSALDEAIRRNPRFAWAFYHRGSLLEKQGKPDAAIADLRQSVALDSQLPEPHYALARIYRARGEMGAADAEAAEFEQRKQAAMLQLGYGPVLSPRPRRSSTSQSDAHE